MLLYFTQEKKYLNLKEKSLINFERCKITKKLILLPHIIRYSLKIRLTQSFRTEYTFIIAIEEKTI
jgi:hypothetical protein